MLKIISAALVALPIVAAAAFSSPGGSLFAQAASTGYGGAMVDICHKTGKGYSQISVSAAAAKAHQNHGDIVPAPSGGCPTT